MDPVEAARYFYGAGFRGQALITMVATAIGESGLNPNARGDTTITNRTWGPSIGLSQIRSLNAQRGTGGSRDANRLSDPAFNAQAAFEISGGGRNFRPWTVFTSGKYRKHLQTASAAVSQMMQSGQFTPTGGGAPAFIQGQSIAGMDFLAQFGQAQLDPMQPVISTMDGLLTVLLGGSKTGSSIGLGSPAMQPVANDLTGYGTGAGYGGSEFGPGNASPGGAAGGLATQPGPQSQTPAQPAPPRRPPIGVQNADRRSRAAPIVSRVPPRPAVRRPTRRV
jgi:hypothetical protein